MSLQSKVDAFLSSPGGKKKIAEAKAKAFREGRSFGQSMDINTFVQEAIRDMKEILAGELRSVHLEAVADSGIIVGEPVVDGNGDVTVDISLDKGMLHRDSLYPGGYPAGIENIAIHLTHGWSAGGYVYGRWARAGGVIRSAQHYEGNNFMQRAVNTFNSTGRGEAELSGEYQ